jgi:hypothetical protein
VTDYGADPTGRLDSTEALQQAISDAFGSPVDTHLMEGGTYKISRPLRLPDTSGGNFMVRCPITFFHFFFLKKKKLFFSIIDQFNI